ncbi:MAG: SufE family protein [Gammaproteobacteria bacterium]
MTSIMTSLDDIVEIFELLGDWEQRYQYLTELGEKLPAMPVALMTPENKVRGCMSEVWVCACRDEHDPDIIRYYGECDTSIIKGVLAILIQLASGKTVAAVEQLDVDELFSRLNLDEHLSPNRHVGVYAIVDLMKRQARELQRSSVGHVAGQSTVGC